MEIPAKPVRDKGIPNLLVSNHIKGFKRSKDNSVALFYICAKYLADRKIGWFKTNTASQDTSDSDLGRTKSWNCLRESLGKSQVTDNVHICIFADFRTAPHREHVDHLVLLSRHASKRIPN